MYLIFESYRQIVCAMRTIVNIYADDYSVNVQVTPTVQSILICKVRILLINS